MFTARVQHRLILTSALLAATSSASAQSIDIEFTNAPEMPAIQLKDGTNVLIDGDGDLAAQCVLDQAGKLCAGVQTGGPSGPVPAVTLARVGNTDVATGTPTQFNWTAQPSAGACVATSQPVVTGWNSDFVAGTGGSKNLTFSSAGAYTLSLKCYNDHGVSNTASLAVTVVGGQNPNPGTVPACNVDGIKDSPLVQPAGYTGHMVAWSSMFYGASFPNTSTFLAPVGAYTLRSLNTSTRGPDMRARYLSTEFVAGADSIYRLKWYAAQPISDAGRGGPFPSGYNPARVADSVLVTISPCAGDLRPFNSLSSDPWLKRCRARLSNGTISFGTNGAIAACPLQPGQKYYLNIALVNTDNGSVPTTTTCKPSDNHRCEVNFGQ